MRPPTGLWGLLSISKNKPVKYLPADANPKIGFALMQGKRLMADNLRRLFLLELSVAAARASRLPSKEFSVNCSSLQISA